MFNVQCSRRVDHWYNMHAPALDLIAWDNCFFCVSHICFHVDNVPCIFFSFCLCCIKLINTTAPRSRTLISLSICCCALIRLHLFKATINCNCSILRVVFRTIISLALSAVSSFNIVSARSSCTHVDNSKILLALVFNVADICSR